MILMDGPLLAVSPSQLKVKARSNGKKEADPCGMTARKTKAKATMKQVLLGRDQQIPAG